MHQHWRFLFSPSITHASFPCHAHAVDDAKEGSLSYTVSIPISQCPSSRRDWACSEIYMYICIPYLTITGLWMPCKCSLWKPLLPKSILKGESKVKQGMKTEVWQNDMALHDDDDDDECNDWKGHAFIISGSCLQSKADISITLGFLGQNVNWRRDGEKNSEGKEWKNTATRAAKDDRVMANAAKLKHGSLIPVTRWTYVKTEMNEGKNVRKIRSESQSVKCQVPDTEEL